MKIKSDKTFLLIPIGLFVLSLSLLMRQLYHMQDLQSGILTGVGLGLILLPFVIRKIKLRRRFDV